MNGYAKFYEDLFKPLKDKPLKILEIGSFYGNASVALFFYFRNSQIYSADINPDMYIYRSKRLKNFFTDTSSRSSIENDIIKKNVKFDLIIEDASHMLKDQILSLFILFKILKPGGYFIIEEIDFPEKREDMRVNQEFPDLKTILKKINNKELKLCESLCIISFSRDWSAKIIATEYSSNGTGCKCLLTAEFPCQ